MRKIRVALLSVVVVLAFIGLEVPSAISNAATVGVPPAPTSVSAASGNGQATVRWVAPSRNNGSAILGYIVTPYIGRVAQPRRTFDSSATTRIITALTNGLRYTFRVAARNANGKSEQSVPSDAIAIGTPFALASVSAVPGDAQVTLSWNPPTNNGYPIKGYVITPFRDLVQQPPIGVAAVTSKVVGGLINGKAYSFAVSAKNANGVSLPTQSRPVTVGAPVAPTGVGATARAGGATVHWLPPARNNGSPVTAYVVTPYADGAALPARTFHSTATTATVTGITPDSTYRFKVAAQNERGVGVQSASSNALIMVPPTTVPTTPPGTTTTTTTTTTTVTSLPVTTTTTTSTSDTTSTTSTSTTSTSVPSGSGVDAARPFSSSSPFNTPTPAGTAWFDTPSLHLLSDGSERHWYVNDASAAVWWASASDPVWTFNLSAFVAPGWDRNRPAASFQVHAPAGLVAGTDSDHILVVIDQVSGSYVEVWGANVNAGARTVTNLAGEVGWATGNAITGPGAGSLSNNDGVRAANFSWAAGLITGADVAAGKIDHALAVCLPYDMLMGGGLTGFQGGNPSGVRAYRAPATAWDASYETGPIQMGSRIGIPAGTPRPSHLSVLGNMAWDALQKYGAFVGDYCGGQWPEFFVDSRSLAVGNAHTGLLNPFFAWWEGLSPTNPDQIPPAQGGWDGTADLEKIGPLLRIADYQP